MKRIFHLLLLLLRTHTRPIHEFCTLVGGSYTRRSLKTICIVCLVVLFPQAQEIEWQYGEGEKWKKLGFYVDDNGYGSGGGPQKLNAWLWKINGFKTPEEALPWASGSSKLKNLLGILKGSYGPREAGLWRLRGFESPEVAEAWRKYGFTPKNGRQWKIKGVSPEVARKYINLGITFNDVFDWYKAGIPSEKIKSWSEQGFTPESAQGWENQLFSPEAALEWQAAGFKANAANEWWEGGFEKMPKQSAAWRETNLSIKDSFRAHEKGHNPEDYIKQTKR